MTAYTISITPDDDSATTRLRLDTSGEQVVLTDLHLHASDGLSTGQLPAIDYGLLLQAITPTTPTPRSIPAAPSTPTAEITAPDAAAPSTAPAAQAPSRAHKRTAAGKTASKTTRSARRSADAPAPAAQPAAGSRTRRAYAARKPIPVANKSARAAKKTTKATPTKTTSGSGRAYRRMPEDFAAVYQQAGSATAAAEHYQVPRHTANGWIRRLRDQGTIPTSR